MPRAALAIVVGTLVLAAPAPAHADPAPARVPLSPSEARTMMIAGDVFAATLIGGGLGIFWKYRNCDCEEMGSGPVMMLGVLAYASWGPLGHADQGSRPRAVASGALRIGLPLAGVALAQKLDRDTGTTLAFAAGGMVSATMIDWFVLGLPARVAKPPVSIYVAPADGGAIAGISGVL